MITVYTGLPGNGKSLALAETVVILLRRNQRMHRKLLLKNPNAPKRTVLSNIKFSTEVEEKNPGFIRYFSDPNLLIFEKDCDIIFDEMATYLDSSNYAMLPLEFKRFLQQHRKRGIDIYGTTQDFAMIDIAVRRVASSVIYCKKIAGSRDLSATRPPPWFLWGICRYRDVDRKSFSSGQDEYTFTDIIGDFRFITKELCAVYDTTQELESMGYPPLRHISRKCRDCNTVKIVHT